jgi:hypothetical protein
MLEYVRKLGALQARVTTSINYVQPFKCNNLFKMKNEIYLFFQEICTYVHRKPKPFIKRCITLSSNSILKNRLILWLGSNDNSKKIKNLKETWFYFGGRKHV